MVSGFPGLYPLDANGISPSHCDNYKRLQTPSDVPKGRMASRGEPLCSGLWSAPACTVQEELGGPGR